MKVKSESEVAQSCPTLSNPIDCSLLGSSVLGILQARVLEWGAIAFSELYSLWGCKGSDTTEQLSTEHMHLVTPVNLKINYFATLPTLTCTSQK